MIGAISMIRLSFRVLEYSLFWLSVNGTLK